MAKIKTGEIRKMSGEERTKKIEELKMELIKARVNASKAGSSKIKEIKKIIARLLTPDKTNK
jgi:large subunit ribosomal protein L29